MTVDKGQYRARGGLQSRPRGGAVVTTIADYYAVSCALAPLRGCFARFAKNVASKSTAISLPTLSSHTEKSPLRHQYDLD
jgi:hypothetical protein